ncbi:MULTISPECIES: fatty acyl-AMP ligase [unclassified Saccharothrix]|uniref:fatty acyl-AMP ligase n=1 Tax=unclassified Saccharothrix TaxID=2593673 RepID=UPI00307E0F35
MPVVDVMTVVELLRHQARRIPDRRSHVFLDSGGQESATLTFGELDRRAKAVAARLGDLVPPGACAVLSYPPSLEFLPAFFGCLYAGVVAVPAPATRRTHGDARLERLAAIIADARPDCVLSTSHHLAGRYLADRALATDLVDPTEADRWTPTPVAPDTTAYLQYTSGTTKAPKGVVLTHDNVLGNLSLITDHDTRAGERREAPTVTWLPLFHDMGLIGGVLRPLYLGHTSVLMAPHVFARSPITWLEALDRYRAEIAAAPSLGYDLCVRRVTEAQRDGLDLSRLRIAVISDEPLRPETIDAFARHFAPSGFRRDAFLPSYGLAESTVLVSGGPLDGEPLVTAFDADALALGRVRTAEPGARVRRLVACGAPEPSLTVVVTDPDGRPTDDVGEIRVSGPSVGLGYWRRPAESNATFQSTVDGHPGERFLRTGNLGFLHDGLLHVLCRTEDLITVEGHLHLPYDLEEAVVAADPAIRAACAFTDPEGRVVVLAETRDDVSVTVPGVDLVVPVRPGTLRHTTSGKLRRADSRAAWLSAREERTGR